MMNPKSIDPFQMGARRAVKYPGGLSKYFSAPCACQATYGPKKPAGFTLIELMIVVAIVGLLTAIALPNFTALKLRSKRAELPTNVEAIRTAEIAYMHEWDTYTSCLQSPASLPGRDKVDFGFSIGDGSDWDLLGWMADGKVYAQYSVDSVSGSNAEQNFSVQAYADLDGDTALSICTANKNDRAGFESPNSVF